MVEFAHTCRACGAGVHQPQAGLCRPCAQQAQYRRWAEEARRAQGYRVTDLLYDSRTPYTYSAISGVLLLLITYFWSAANAMLAFVGLLSAYVPIVCFVSFLRRPRVSAKERRARLLRDVSVRYAERLAPPHTRCAFCRCDFSVNEVAASCRGCRSLLHRECAEELLSNPGPRCPNFGCRG